MSHLYLIQYDFLIEFFMSTTLGFVYTQVQVTCTNQLLVADTPPQPAMPPAETQTDRLMSPQQSNGSTDTYKTQFMFMKEKS